MAIIFARPLERLAAKTLRPAGLEDRARKPYFLARLRFWGCHVRLIILDYLLCLTLVILSYVSAKQHGVYGEEKFWVFWGFTIVENFFRLSVFSWFNQFFYYCSCRSIVLRSAL